MAFLTGFIIGGILATSVAHFVIATLLGGFALAITYGSSFGFPTYFSSLLVVPIHGFAAYAVMKIIYAIERHPRAEPYLTRLRKRYEDGAEFLLNHVGRLGIVGALTLSTFAAGWLATVAIAYILGVSVSTAVKSTVLGLLIGAGVSYATYEGLIKAFPNPMIVTVAILILFGIIAYVIERMAKREHERHPRRY